MNLRMAFSTSTKVAIEFLSETPPNLWVLSCRTVIWRTLCFPVHECGTSSYSFSFFQECLFQFSVCKLCISDYVYSWVLIIFSAFVNGIIFLIPSADCSVFCAQTQLNVIALALSPWFVLFVCFLWRCVRCVHVHANVWSEGFLFIRLHHSQKGNFISSFPLATPFTIETVLIWSKTVRFKLGVSRRSRIVLPNAIFWQYRARVEGVPLHQSLQSCFIC